MKIFITDGNNRAALAISRSLGKCGHEILVGEKNLPCLSSKSRYCAGAFQYLDPVTDPTGFSASLSDYCHKMNIDMIIPVSDVTTLLLTEQKDTLFKNISIPFPENGTVQNAADKLYITELAESIGIPTPKTVPLYNLNDLDLVDNVLQYPVVIKPSRSRVRTNNGWLFTHVSYANSREELMSKLSNKHVAEFPVLLQERIIGPGIGIFICCDKGTIIRAFSHRRLREKPPSGGVSVFRESIRPEPQALQSAKLLMEKLMWHGVAMVEFKLDVRDMKPKLMEINGRFWGSLQLAIDSGVDFPVLLLDLYQNKNINTEYSYKTGIKSRWLLGDLDLLIMLLFKSRKKLNLPPNYNSRIKSLMNFLKFWQPGLHYEIFRLNDIKPFIYELKNWIIHRNN